MSGDLPNPSEVGVRGSLRAEGPAAAEGDQHPDQTAEASEMSLPGQRPHLRTRTPPHPTLRHLRPDSEGELLL